MQPGHLLGQRLQTQADSECAQAWDSSFVHTNCDLWHGRPGAYVSQHLGGTQRFKAAGGRLPGCRGTHQSGDKESGVCLRKLGGCHTLGGGGTPLSHIKRVSATAQEPPRTFCPPACSPARPADAKRSAFLALCAAPPCSTAGSLPAAAPRWSCRRASRESPRPPPAPAGAPVRYPTPRQSDTACCGCG